MKLSKFDVVAPIIAITTFWLFLFYMNTESIKNRSIYNEDKVFRYSCP